MGYSQLIRDGLKENKISITKAALWLNITRQGFYKKLSSGNFYVNELDVLIAKGAISKKKAFSLITDVPFEKKKMLTAGDQVICTLKDAVWTSNDGKTISGPKHKEVCTISGVDASGDLLLIEYPINEGFWAGAFKKK